MSTSRDMKTLSAVLNKIMASGYRNELKIAGDIAWFENGSRKYLPHELLIEKVYRFAGESDPADMSVLYIISGKNGEAGFFINAYGTYSGNDNPYYDTFIRSIPVSGERKRNRKPASLKKWKENRKAIKFGIIIHGSYYILFGAWPIGHIRSFMAVTGPKTDLWMVYTIGGLLTGIGTCLILLNRIKRIWVLQATSAITLLAIDIQYATRGIISDIYLIDGAIQIIFLLFALAVLGNRESISDKHS